MGAVSRSAVFAVATALWAGCGPVRAGSLIVEAAAELAAAETAQAEAMAPYELAAAESYLHKAREDHSYAKFETAEIFAEKARDCARLARARAEEQTRRDLGATGVESLPRGLACRAGSRAVKRVADPEEDLLPATLGTPESRGAAPGALPRGGRGAAAGNGDRR